MKVFQVISFKEGCDAHASETTVNTNMFTLVQLGLIKDPRKGKDKIDRFITRRDMECQVAVLYLQQISEAHHYDRYKSRFLYQNSVKCYYGYIIRPDKVEAFLNNDFHPDTKKITISVCQDRIPKIGQEKIKYIVYHDEYVSEFDRATIGDLVVCRKSDYFKNHEHYGKYILVDVIRPEIMWGTFEEIERDIKRIILDRLHEENLIEFLTD